MSSTPQPQPQPVKSEEPPMHSLTPTPSTPATPQAYTWAIDPALQTQSATPAQNTTTATPTPAPTTTTTPAPAPAPTTYQYAQPGSTGTYQYGYYPGYYGYHAQAGTAAAPTATPATSTPAANTTASTTAANNANNSQVDSSDIATLNDALGSAGVDLRAEEESLQTQTSSFRTSNTYLSAQHQHGDRTRKQPPAPAFNTTFIGATMKTIGTQHKITRIPEDSVNYLSLALRARLGDLITNMIKASTHRTSTQFDRPATLYPTPSIDTTKGGVIVSPDGSSQQVTEAMVTDPIPMWSILIRSDVAKQLGAIEKVEREEELRVRRERKERAELAASHAAALAAASAGGSGAGGAGAGAGGDGDEDGQPKKKRKKEGPGVTARNMSEDVRKKMSNAVASQAAGLGGRYAWMTAANANAPPPPKKAQASTPAPTNNPATMSSGAPSTPTPTSKVYTATTGTGAMKVDEDPRTKVTMRDAMFVVSTERGHGGGRGAARGWT
ncbi:hypothetical protein VNI00_002889 [Paramarasmius palmivorus]|uniref:Transcription initiation factor TFIID subunit 4 n=1 Tax=Paramarasmius palmivorus TaxID=297713 RepID=A0AAW0DZK3_9AGAR